MESKYPFLHVISICLKIVSVIVVLAGISIMVVILAKSTSPQSTITSSDAIHGLELMIASIIAGIIIYAYAELIDCFVDIELNTRATEFNTRLKKDSVKNSITEKQRQIAELQAQVAEELKKQ